MIAEFALIALSVTVVAALLTQRIRRAAQSRGLIDIPNERSSHSMPTPRGGGAAVVLAASCGFGVLAWRGALPVNLLLTLVCGGGIVAAIGWLDDRYTLSARLRIVVHAFAGLLAMVLLRGVPELQIGNQMVVFGWVGHVLGAVCIVWMLNLYNFMDGIDGLAASEAVFVVWAAAALTLAGAGSVQGLEGVGAAIVFGAACAGFLVWNWPPAKIFMGDVGSGYMGYIIAVLAIAAGKTNPVAPFVWLILGSAFFTDATVTLLRRLCAGEPVYEAHRSHAYQVLARRFGSHLVVTVAVSLLNVLVLLPLAYLAMRQPASAWWMAAATVGGLSLLVLKAGADSSCP